MIIAHFHLMRDEIPIAGIREWLCMLRRQRFGKRVEGDSMWPTLRSGDRVLVDPKAAIHAGDIVVAEHPFKSLQMIKRLLSIEPDGRIFLAGDNPEASSDSKVFGAIQRKHLLGKVVSRLI
ncbi:MAG: nickel-type superoxide dismutase maturation protease [Pyrinomonadaceae bacterium]